MALRDFERDLIRQAIQETGSIAAGARALKVAPTTLKYKCKKYRIASPWRYGQPPR
jgi:transcriptional regulator with GAF, ATPase, and Fis domain